MMFSLSMILRLQTSQTTAIVKMHLAAISILPSSMVQTSQKPPFIACMVPSCTWCCETVWKTRQACKGVYKGKIQF